MKTAYGSKWLVCWLAMAAGCGGEADAPAAGGSTLTVEQGMREAGLGYMAEELKPWRTKLNPGRLESSSSIGGGSRTHELILDLQIVTEDSRPKKSVSGTLIVRGRDGKVIYREPYTFEPELSFGSHVNDSIQLQYDDANADHRALRHDLQKKAEFEPVKVVYADGDVKTDGFGETSLLEEGRE